MTSMSQVRPEAHPDFADPKWSPSQMREEGRGTKEKGKSRCSSPFEIHPFSVAGGPWSPGSLVAGQDASGLGFNAGAGSGASGRGGSDFSPDDAAAAGAE